MPNFTVKSIRQMEPMAGQKFATTYYKQSNADYKKTGEWILDRIDEFVRAMEQHDMVQELITPLADFPKLRGENYTIYEILNDLKVQYKLQRDWPQGMIGRWNRLFQDQQELQINFIKVENDN